MDQDARTLIRKPARYEPADTIGRAGDQHGFRFKVHISVWARTSADKLPPGQSDCGTQVSRVQWSSLHGEADDAPAMPWVD
jgi:hypothetical protein